MSQYLDLERPGTSFTQKRHIYTQDGGRIRNFNVGLLDTDQVKP